MKSKTFTRPTRLLVMFSVLNSQLYLSPLYPSLPILYHTILSFFDHVPSLSGSLNTLIPLSILLSVLLSTLYSTISSRLSSVTTFSEKPSLDPQTTSGSIVTCLCGMTFFPFRALIWAFNYQSISETRWWMPVFSALTLGSMRTRTMSGFVHHYIDRRQHNALNLVDLQ